MPVEPMSAEPTRRFLDVLPPDVADGRRLPLLYAVLTGTTQGDPYVPTATCDHHRTVGYFCLPFHKPISRCFGADR